MLHVQSPSTEAAHGEPVSSSSGLSVSCEPSDHPGDPALLASPREPLENVLKQEQVDSSRVHATLDTVPPPASRLGGQVHQRA